MISQKERWFNILSFVNEEYVIESDPLKQCDKRVERKVIEPERENTSLSGKRTAISINAKKILAFAVSACLIIAAILIGIIVPSLNKPTQPTKLEYGFEVISGEPHSDDFCAFKSDTNRFDKDNVTLEFYFGAIYCSSEELGKSIPEFDIYFTDNNDNMLYLVRHVEENYVSDKYKVELEYNRETKKTKVIYSHSEKITIPPELFVADEGLIGFRLGGVDVSSTEQNYHIFNCTWIYYKMDGTKVILSNQKL